MCVCVWEHNYFIIVFVTYLSQFSRSSCRLAAAAAAAGGTSVRLKVKVNAASQIIRTFELMAHVVSAQPRLKGSPVSNFQRAFDEKSTHIIIHGSV